MENPFVIADSDGKIIQYGEVPDSTKLYFTIDEETGTTPIWLDEKLEDQTKYYVDNGVVVPRPELNADWTAIPTGTRIIVDHSDAGRVIDTTLASETDVDIDTSLPGTYVIEFEPPFPYFNRSEIIDVPSS